MELGFFTFFLNSFDLKMNFQVEFVLKISIAFSLKMHFCRRKMIWIIEKERMLLRIITSRKTWNVICIQFWIDFYTIFLERLFFPANAKKTFQNLFLQKTISFSKALVIKSIIQRTSKQEGNLCISVTIISTANVNVATFWIVIVVVRIFLEWFCFQ